VDPRKAVLAIVKAHAPDASLDEDLPLGANGLGLDSIAIAEVLLACEERFGISCGPLLESDGLTIARLAQHLGAATQ
jgi:acyl carrier protein